MVGEILRHLEEESHGTESKASEEQAVSAGADFSERQHNKAGLQVLEKLQELLSQDKTVTAGVKKAP